MVIAHRKELLHQAYKMLSNYFPDDQLTFEIGNRHADPHAQIVLCSVNTVGRSGSTRLEAFKPSEFGCIIVDEAHHAAAKSYQTIFNHFGLFEPNCPIKLWGCSATLHRHDGVSLTPTFEDVIYEVKVSELMETYLCRLNVFSVHTKVNLDGIQTTGGDFNQKQLALACNQRTRNAAVVKAYLEKQKELGFKSTLIFAVDVDHVNSLVRAFEANSIHAKGLTGRTDPQERDTILTQFRSGKLAVVINCAVLTEGTDIPCIDSIFLARPTKSRTLLQQMLGRGMRISPEKEKCHVFDLVDTFTKRTNLCSVPTLLGLDPYFQMNGDDFGELISLVKSTPNRLQSVKTMNDLNEAHESIESIDNVQVIFKKFIDPFSISMQLEDSNMLSRLTKYAWVRVAENRFILSFGQNEYLDLLKNGQSVEVYKRKLCNFGTGLFKSKKKVDITGETLIQVFTELDRYVQRNIALHSSLRRNSEWRMQKATKTQLKLLNSKDSTLLRGVASDFITKKLFGAQAAELEGLKRSKKDPGILPNL
jgi:ATP-dependent helicase IRC3